LRCSGMLNDVRAKAVTAYAIMQFRDRRKTEGGLQKGTGALVRDSIHNACMHTDMCTHMPTKQQPHARIHIPSDSCKVTEPQSNFLHICRSSVVGGLKRLPNGKIDYAQDFFSRPAFLTVSGQLQVGASCLCVCVCVRFASACISLFV